MRVAIMSLLALFFSVSMIFAQNPYIREGSIGKQKDQTETSEKDPLSFRPIEKWIGEKFIFLPKTKSSQGYGYQAFGGGKGRFGHPTYEECVGRIGRIIKVGNSYSDRITIQMDDNGQTYTASGTESIDGIASFLDLEYARRKWLGKPLWYAEKELVTYNEQTEKFGSVKVRKYSRVKVLDVIASWDSSSPVRFILQTPSEEEGFVDINLSGTNTPYILRDFQRFDEYFLADDPRTTHKWPRMVWSAIEEGRVLIGMTAEQARMSWGKPNEVNRTLTGASAHEQWVYRNRGYLYFENGILKSIQD